MILDGQRLRQARSRAGLTQRELARDSGVGLATISRLERQARPHSHFRTRGRLAMALGSTPEP